MIRKENETFSCFLKRETLEEQEMKRQATNEYDETEDGTEAVWEAG